MTTTVIRAGNIFDGTGWIGAGDVTIVDGRIESVSAPTSKDISHQVMTLMPGLVDVGVSAAGYADLPSADDPFAPERAYARMSLRYGVTTLCDVNNSPAPLAYLADLGAVGDGPRIVHSSGRLATVPTGRHDRQVTAQTAPAAVDALAGDGAGVISVAHTDRAVLDAIRGAADRHGLPVVVARQTRPATPGLMIMRDAAPVDLAAGFGSLAPQADCYFIPQLHASGHWSVDDMLEAPDAHFASPVLPHARNFARSRGRIGKRIARPIVGRYYGDRDPALLDSTVAERAASAALARRCVVSSAGGETGMVPGLSLWSDLDRLAALIGPDGALAAGTTVAARALGRPDIGAIRVGAAADLMLFAARPTSTPSSLLTSLQTVIIAGRWHDMSALCDEVEDLVDKGLREQA